MDESMDKIIGRRFERVEKALATLINSISTYNPAPALANDLVAADAELSQGLEQLSTHQANHAKIVSLRATSQQLDNQIRETLTLLTSTRSALLATPATTFPDTANPVSYSELLSYARRISKFTLPSTYRETDAAAAQEPGTGETTANTPRESKSGTQTNGTSTPIAATAGTNGELPSAMDIDSNTPAAAVAATPAPAPAPEKSTMLPIEYTRYLNPPPDVFIPWPSEFTIRRGALSSIQILVDQGVDPATFDPAKSAELEAERKRIVEEEDRQREEEKARLEEERRREVERRTGGSGGAPPSATTAAPKAAAFEFETFDDDEDD